MNSEGWERPLVGTGVGQRGVDAIRQRGVGGARPWLVARGVGWTSRLVGWSR
jgi:hypothetical protein